MDSIRMIKIGNFEFPYIPAQIVTEFISTGENPGWQEREIFPPFINNLQDFVRNSSTASLTNAKLSASKEAIRYLKDQTGLTMRAYEAPIAVSAKIPRDCFAVVDERIVVNETQGKERAWDADGDRARILTANGTTTMVTEEVSVNGKKTLLHRWRNPDEWAVIAKYPMTVKPNLFKRVDPPVETFSDLSEEDLKWLFSESIEIDEKESFWKNHQPNNVGILQNCWDIHDLISGQEKPTMTEKMNLILANPGRIRDIEGQLKASRKDAGFILGDSETDIREWQGITLDPETSWALLGGKVSGMSESRTSWVLTENPRETMERAVRKAIALDINPIPINARAQDEEPLERKPIDDSISLLDDLKNLGVINWAEIPYSGKHPDGDKLPPVIWIWLERNGEPVGLIDNKRGGQLSYCYLLPPVFDPEAVVKDPEGFWLTDEEGNLITKPQWISAIDHLEKELSYYDRRIISRGRTKGYWPRSLSDMEKFRVKTTQVQEIITTFCDRVGFQVPADIVNDKIMPTPIAIQVAMNTVYIEYQKHQQQRRNYWNIDAMWEICQLAKKSADINISLYGCKGANGKFQLGHPSGAAFLADPESHQARTGKIISQAIRGIGPIDPTTGRQGALWMTVAITMPEKDKLGNIIGTESQIHITPEGVEKQRLKCGLPQAVTVKPEEDTKVPLSTSWAQVDHLTWSGNLRRSWIRPERRQIKVGKLVDIQGNKFMPIEHEQHMGYAANSKINPIDLIIPITELVAKGCCAYFIKNSKPGFIFSGGRWVSCMIGDFPFFRTGNASENMPVTFVEHTDRGLAGMALRWCLRDLNPEIWTNREVNIDYPAKLIETIMAFDAEIASKIEDTTNEVDEVDEEYLATIL